MQDAFKKGKSNLHLHLLCFYHEHKMSNSLGHDNDKIQKLVDRNLTETLSFSWLTFGEGLLFIYYACISSHYCLFIHEVFKRRVQMRHIFRFQFLKKWL